MTIRALWSPAIGSPYPFLSLAALLLRDLGLRARADGEAFGAERAAGDDDAVVEDLRAAVLDLGRVDPVHVEEGGEAADELLRHDLAVHLLVGLLEADAPGILCG